MSEQPTAGKDAAQTEGKVAGDADRATSPGDPTQGAAKTPRKDAAGSVSHFVAAPAGGPIDEDVRPVTSAPTTDGGGADKPTRERAVRLNDLDVSRVTEQVAIIMSRVVGKMGKRSGGEDEGGLGGLLTERPARLMAARLMFGGLREAYCRGRVVQPPEWVAGANKADPRTQIGRLRALWSAFSGPKRFGRVPEGTPGEWDLDCLACPVDGLRDLMYGFDAGAVSVLGGGPQGTFLEPTRHGVPHGDGAARYHFVIGLTQGTKDAENILDNAVNRFSGRDVNVMKVLEQEGVFTWLRKRVGYGTSYVTTAVLERDQPMDLRARLGREFRVRTFRGSSVAAATCVFYQRFGIDAFLGVVTRPQLALIATAARVTGGHMCAFPVKGPDPDSDSARKTRTSQPRRSDSRSGPAGRDGRGDRSEYLKVKVPPNAPVFRGGDLVGDRDVFLVITGVTENLLVKGVRFSRPDRAETHSLVLRAQTGSSRYISNHHDLRRKLPGTGFPRATLPGEPTCDGPDPTKACRSLREINRILTEMEVYIDAERAARRALAIPAGRRQPPETPPED